MNTTSWSTLDSDHADTNNSAYVCGVRRAATVTVTGYTSPRLIHHRKMDRPSSQGVGSERGRDLWTLSPPPFKTEKFVVEYTQRPRSMIVLRDDPFVVDNSDNTASIESSETGDSAHSDSGRQSTNTEPSTPSTEREEPVLAKKPPSSQEMLESFPVPRARPVSMSVIPAATALPVSLGTPSYQVSRQPSPRSIGSYHLTPTRTRPASIAVMSPSALSPTKVSTPELHNPNQSPKRQTFRSGSPVRQTASYDHVLTPSRLDSSTPPSIMRRLSRRLSATPSEHSLSKTNRFSFHADSPIRPSTSRRTSSQISLNNGVSDISNMSPIALPNPQQLANLERWNLQQHTQIMRTPPQIRARNATAPRAASGARRYGMFPDFDALEAGGFRLVEEDDTLAEEENASPEPIKDLGPNTMTAPVSSMSNAQPTVSVIQPQTPQTPLARKSTIRSSATKRLSMIGSRISGSAVETPAQSPEKDRSRKREKKGGFCRVM